MNEEKNVKEFSKIENIQETKTIVEQMKSCSCKIYKNSTLNGLGFFYKIPFPDKYNLFPVLIINKNLLSLFDLEIGKTLKISIHDEKEFKEIKIEKSRTILILEKYDFILIEIKENEDKINNFIEFDDKVNENKKYMNEKYNKKKYIF